MSAQPQGAGCVGCLFLILLFVVAVLAVGFLFGLAQSFGASLA